jgi:hypothetical protein
MNKFVPCDKYGYPVERIKGRPLKNLIRLLLHTRQLRRGKVQYPDGPNDPTCWRPDDPSAKETTP